MPSILDRYNKIVSLPAGRYIFSKLVGFNAPFFGKIKPYVIELRPSYCEVQIKDRWGIRNHLGTINAGALCSLAEMTGGMALDSVVPSSMRWIPRSMTVQYIKKATGLTTAISQFDPTIVEQAISQDGNVVIPIIVSNEKNQTVFNADITFYVSAKPSKQP